MVDIEEKKGKKKGETPGKMINLKHQYFSTAVSSICIMALFVSSRSSRIKTWVWNYCGENKLNVTGAVMSHC